MNDIVLVGGSWIRTEEEKELVLETIQTLSSCGTPVVIVDRGSPEEAKERIRSFPNVHFFESTEETTIGQIIRANKEAAKLGKYLFYTQTDKYDFVKTDVLRIMHFYSSLEEKGFCIPSRTKESMQTYPEYQKTQEAFLNFFISDYVGIKDDYFAGPKIYPAKLVSYMDHIRGEIGWGVEAYLYVLGKRLGLPFDFVPVMINSPKDIESSEKTKLYRLEITNWQIDGFMQATSLIL